MVLKNLWHFTRAYIEHGDSIPLPSYIYIAFTEPRITQCILGKGDIAAHVIGRCVGALVVTKLVADINARNLPVSDAESACLTAILGDDYQDVTHWSSLPGAIQFLNIVFLISDNIIDDSWSPTSDVLDVVQETFCILSQALPAPLNAQMQLDLTDALMVISEGRLNPFLNLASIAKDTHQGPRLFPM